jgi:hypothetical protein
MLAIVCISFFEILLRYAVVEMETRYLPNNQLAGGCTLRMCGTVKIHTLT